MRYAGIINNDVVNGYDVCVSFWCQGCPFHCEGCHNKHTWDFDGGFQKNDDELIKDVIERINRNGIHRNLSILGGEPLCEQNAPFVASLIKEVKKVYPKIEIYIWTGYEFENLLRPSKTLLSILRQTNIIVDGKFEIEHRDISLPFRGSSNQRIIDVQKSLREGKVVECDFKR